MSNADRVCTIVCALRTQRESLARDIAQASGTVRLRLGAELARVEQVLREIAADHHVVSYAGGAVPVAS
jgi:hypothetical protein